MRSWSLLKKYYSMFSVYCLCILIFATLSGCFPAPREYVKTYPGNTLEPSKIAVIEGDRSMGFPITTVSIASVDNNGDFFPLVKSACVLPGEHTICARAWFYYSYSNPANSTSSSCLLLSAKPGETYIMRAVLQTNWKVLWFIEKNNRSDKSINLQ